MKVEAVALSNFTHDDIEAREGRVFSVDEPLALEMERAGLIRIKPAVLRGRRMIGALPGKVQAAGAGAPSSASPAAQASTSTTAPGSVAGAMQRRNSGRS